MMRYALLRHCFALLVGATLALPALPAHAAPENGWWWNPAENGRGFFIEVQNNVLVLAGYLYADDGRATWLLSAGPMASPNAYSGRLLSFAGGQTLFGDYKPPAPAPDAGPITLTFIDDTHATLLWPGGEVSIERQPIGGRTPEFDPTGWWWNPAESGRGFSVEVRDTTLFIAGFMYDDTGQPVWYLSAGPMATPTHYEGALLQIAGGQTLTGEYQAPDSSSTVATITVDFASADAATITLEGIGAAAALSTRAAPPKGPKTIIVAQPQNPRTPRPPLPPPPPTLAYQIVLEGPIYREIRINNPIVGQTGSTIFESPRITWLQTTNPSIAPLAPYNTPEWIYFEPYGGSAPIKVVYTESNIGCTTTGTVNDPVKVDDGFLYLNLVTKEYVGQIIKPAFAILNLKTVCPNLTYSQAKLFDQVGFKFRGTATNFPVNQTTYFNLAGNEPRMVFETLGFRTEVYGDWRFTQR